MRQIIRPCPYPGCPVLTNSGRCAEHRKRAEDEADARRGSARQRGYDADWRQARAFKLANDPVCQIRKLCNGAYATEVDHIIPIQDRPDLRLEYSNLQSACQPCNSSKARDDAKKRRAGTINVTKDTKKTKDTSP